MQVSSHPALHMLPMLNTKMTISNGCNPESSNAHNSSNGVNGSSSNTTKKSPATSPTTMSRLPNLQYAISHRRTELRLPAFARGYESSNNSCSSSSNQDMYVSPQLSMTQCETPHYSTPGVPSCPETSPTEKKAALSLETASSFSSSSFSSSSSTKKKGTRRGTLNAEAKNVLKAWMFSPEHFAHPYPSEEEKEELANEAGIEVKQLSNWFTNARKRLWQPVLRQSGVEVKNFLSTGRGGPRGNKLEIPANLQQILAQHAYTPPDSPMGNDTPLEDNEEEEEEEEEEVENDDDEKENDCSSSPLKRSWSEVVYSSHQNSNNSQSSHNSTSSSNSQYKRHKDDSSSASFSRMMTMNHSKMANVSKLSQELRLALADAASPSSSSSSSNTLTSSSSTLSASIQELEILAAKSLIGLCQQRVH
jgi:hypothetical protein